MRRRTLLQGALGLPIVSCVGQASNKINSVEKTEDTGVLFSGLAGLDYAVGGVAAGELLCFAGPPCTRKTLLLLDWASRICGRYGKNVVFYSAHQPSVYLAKKAALRGESNIYFVEGSVAYHKGAGILLIDSTSADVDRICDAASRLRREHPAGCALVILDGWSTYPERIIDTEVVAGVASYPAERWPHALVTTERSDQLKGFAGMSRISVVMGVTTASLMDVEALAASRDLESELRRNADHWVNLHRPELYKSTADVRAGERNVVELTGTSPKWWDTRCSKVRYDAREISFATVI